MRIELFNVVLKIIYFYYL